MNMDRQAPTAAKDQQRIPASVRAEASVWIARLHDDERTPAVEAGFRQWLKADPMNARAFELSTEVWEESQNLRRVVPFAHETAKPRGYRFQFASVATLACATAAVLVLAMIVGVYFWPRTVATGIGEQRLLTLEDGSRVFLNTATRVTVRYTQQQRLIELASGEALFDVSKNPNRPFIVRVGNRQVRALGTSFVVRRDPDQLAVTLVEGTVAVMRRSVDASVGVTRSDSAAASTSSVTSGTHSTTLHAVAADSADVITLKAGQRLVIARNLPAHVDTLSVEKATAWRRGQVILDDTPLAEAISEMNRYNSRRLVLDSAAVEHVLINGLFQVGDSLSFAHAVAHSYGLRVTERANEIVLSAPAAELGMNQAVPPVPGQITSNKFPE